MATPAVVKWSESRCAQYEFSLILDAAPEHAWQALTQKIGNWWLPHFHMLGPESAIVFEPRAGGRLFEQLGDRELLWYQVLAIDPIKTLELSGWCTARYGGPAATLLSLDLRTLDDGRTELLVSDSLFGQVTEGMVRSVNAGWQELFKDGLQAYLKNR